MMTAMDGVRTVAQAVSEGIRSIYDTPLNTSMSPPSCTASLRSALFNMLQTDKEEDLRHQEYDEGEDEELPLSPGTYRAMAIGMGGLGVVMGAFALNNFTIGNYGMAALDAGLAIWNLVMAASDWQKAKIAESQQ